MQVEGAPCSIARSVRQSIEMSRLNNSPLCRWDPAILSTSPQLNYWTSGNRLAKEAPFSDRSDYLGCRVLIGRNPGADYAVSHEIKSSAARALVTACCARRCSGECRALLLLTTTEMGAEHRPIGGANIGHRITSAIAVLFPEPSCLVNLLLRAQGQRVTSMRSFARRFPRRCCARAGQSRLPHLA